MYDVLDLVKNIESIYDSNTSFVILKDFERVIDEVGIYVYDNWEDGELADGPNIDRHWVTCSFMWPRDKMPDPSGGKRLLDYGCKIYYKKDHLIKPKKIVTPDDIRPHTKKGKLQRAPIWIVTIKMPKELINDIYDGYADMYDLIPEKPSPKEIQPSEELAAESSEMTELPPEGEL